jgi:inhibitor of KinA sporulation pathway (predicted exonuclease)
VRPASYPYYLVVDVEATCCNDNSIPREETEIIEIGAVLCDRKSLRPVDELQTFVRPVRHPVLTPFCTELTSITQADLEGAPLFPDALAALAKLRGEKRALFCSWGAYDKKQFQRECRGHGVPFPLGTDHLNLKEEFSRRRGDSKLYGMAQALKLAGLDLDGTHHRGIDDARNIARLLPFIVGDEKASQRR